MRLTVCRDASVVVPRKRGFGRGGFETRPYTFRDGALTENLIEGTDQLIVSRRPFVDRQNVNAFRSFLRKAPFHIFARRQAILARIDFLRLAREEKIGEQSGGVGMGAYFAIQMPLGSLISSGSGIT